MDSESSDRERSRRSERGSRFDNDRNDDKSRDRNGNSSGECRRIYVSNIPYEYRWQDLKDLFRREVDDVVFVDLFSDESNKPRGCGIIEFEKAESVKVAMDKMNRFDLNGRNLVIKEDHGNERDKYGRVVAKSGSGSGGGGSGNSGGGSRDNFRRDRDEDRISHLSSSFNDRSSSHGMKDYIDSSNFNTYGLSTKFLEGLGIQGPLHHKVFVANLDYKVDAKKLKQVFKLAGKVVSLDLSLDKEGHSRGFAVVEYEHPVEAVQAISMFDRQILFDRRMTVRLDRIPEKVEGVKLPEGLKGIGIGLGPNGEPLRDVARNLPNSNSNNSLGMNQNSAPTPVAPPLTNASSLLGPVPNNSSLSGLSSNLAALSNVVGGLSNLGGLQGVQSALSNPLLSSAAALGLNLSNQQQQQLQQNNDMQQQQSLVNQSQASYNSLNAYNTTGFNNNNNSNQQGRGDFDLSGQGNQIRNYNTQSNEDYSNRNFGNTGGNSGGNNLGQRGPSDTIVARNLPSNWTWQNLRDKFRDVGEVKFAEIRGQDTGVVRFAKERDAEVAIKLMDGSRIDGRTIDINFF